MTSSARRCLSCAKNLVLNFGLLSLVVVFLAWRWQLLQQAQGLSLSLFRSAQLTVLSSFFSMFLTGSVAADLVRLWYAASEHPEERTRSALTVMVDRIISSVALMVFTSVALFLSPSLLEPRTGLRPFAEMLNHFLIVAGIGTLLLAFFIPRTAFWRPFLAKFGAKYPFIAKVQLALMLYHTKKLALFFAFVLSGLSLLVTITLYFLEAELLGMHLPFSCYFVIVPLSIVVSYVTFVPFGIGVGQISFFYLVGLVGGSPEAGTTLCTVLQGYNILFHIVGGLAFLRFRKKSAMRPPNDLGNLPMTG